MVLAKKKLNKSLIFNIKQKQIKYAYVIASFQNLYTLTNFILFFIERITYKYPAVKRLKIYNQKSLQTHQTKPSAVRSSPTGMERKEDIIHRVLFFKPEMLTVCCYGNWKEWDVLLSLYKTVLNERKRLRASCPAAIIFRTS